MAVSDQPQSWSKCFQDETRQAMHINIEAHSPKYCCHRKAISITSSECVFASFVIQNAKCMIFRKVIEYTMYVLIFSTTFI
jgi:hypothetical protein